eukprot:sb/3462212/
MKRERIRSHGNNASAELLRRSLYRARSQVIQQLRKRKRKSGCTGGKGDQSPIEPTPTEQVLTTTIEQPSSNSTKPLPKEEETTPTPTPKIDETASTPTPLIDAVTPTPAIDVTLPTPNPIIAVTSPTPAPTIDVTPIPTPTIAVPTPTSPLTIDVTTPTSPPTIGTAPLSPTTTLPTSPSPDNLIQLSPTSPAEKDATLEQILEILNDLSRNSNSSYQLLCNQLLRDQYLQQELQTPSSPSQISSPSTKSSPQLVAAAPPAISSTAAPQAISSSVPPVGERLPPPNVTISYTEQVRTPTVNPELRPVINIPDMFTTDQLPPSSSSLITTSTNTSSRPVITSVSAATIPQTISNHGNHCNHVVTSCSIMTSSGQVTSSSPPLNKTPDYTEPQPPQLPPRSEFSYLSDLSSLEGLLELLKEKGPLPSSNKGASSTEEMTTRCTCKSMLRCPLHERRKPGPKPRKAAPTPPHTTPVPTPTTTASSNGDQGTIRAKRKYCYRGSKKPYKFIPVNFKDCDLPANKDTIIGTGGLSSTMSPTGPTPKKSGRGGRRSRVAKPINIPPPPPIPPTSSVTTCIQAGLTPISPAPIMSDGKQRPVVTTPPSNTINLVPVPSVTATNFENTKLLKAVPIGNGLYRLEEASEHEVHGAGGSLSKPVFAADLPTLGAGGGVPGPATVAIATTNYNKAPITTPVITQQSSTVEHHPPAPAPPTVKRRRRNRNTAQIENKGSKPTPTTPVAAPNGGTIPSPGTTPDNTAALNQLIERLLESTGAAGAAAAAGLGDDRLLELISSLPNIQPQNC